MSRFRGHAGDTDRRAFYRPMPPGDDRDRDRDRPFRGPPEERPPWPDRPDWQHRPPPDWLPSRPGPSDWADRPPAASHWSPDGALNVLSSCGLDARDLSLLAELPEDMLTLKSLPQLLSQMKQKKDPYLPPGFGPIPHTDPSRDPYAGPAPRSLDHAPGLYREPGPSHSAFPSASATGFVVDYEHRASDLDYRKSPERLRRTSPGLSPQRSKDWPPRKPPTVPSETQARDFHGKKPSVFPYSCSLCDITVLSENVWTQHINTTLHADRQLSLLQRFPAWDCHLDTARRDGKQPKQEKKSKKDAKEKVPKKGKVVCVKFPARSVDESYLRNLIKDFGQIVNIAMFPSLGFIELESSGQTQNLITFFTENPHKVEQQAIEFSISTTFNFLQSSFVLNFFPVPFGNEGKADLLAIIKRFGTPLYTMFITDTMHAYVEMQNAADAHKMVEYYSTTPLKMNGVNIIVSFSQEFRTLARCARAKPYEENEELKMKTAAEPKKPVDKKKVVKKIAEAQGGGEAQAPEKSAQPNAEGQKKDETPKDTDPEAKKTEDAPDQSGEGSDMDIDGEEVVGAEVVGAKLDEDEEEEDPEMPFNLDSCITLDEVSDSEETAAEEAAKEEEVKAEEKEEEEEEDEDSPRVVYIGNLPLCRFSDPQFIKMVQLVHRPVRYFINRQQRTGLAEFASRKQAREFVAKMQDHSFGGCCLQTFISNKYNRLPWGRGVEYDESGRIMRHFRVGKSPDRKKTLTPPPPPRRHSRRRSKDRDSPRSKKYRDKSRSRGKSRDRSRGRSRGKSRSRDRSRGRAKSRDRSRERAKSRGRSRDRSRGKSRGRSRDRSRNRREKSRSRTPRDKQPTSEETPSAQDKGSDIKIENVVSLKTPDSEGQKPADLTSGQEAGGKKEQGDETGAEGSAKKPDAGDKDEGDKEESQEEGWTVANLHAEDSPLSEETAEASGGEKAAKRNADGEAEAEGKKRKEESGDGEQGAVKTQGGAKEGKVPTKPIGTEFIRLYCALCHVMYSDEQEATAHCSTLPHYHKYKEMTGKDPWSASE